LNNEEYNKSTQSYALFGSGLCVYVMVKQERSSAEFYYGDNCFTLHHQVTTIFVLVCCLCVHSWTPTLDQSPLPLSLCDRSV